MTFFGSLHWFYRSIREAFAGFTRRAEEFWASYSVFFAVSGLIGLFLFLFFFNRIVIFVNTGEGGVRFWRFYGTEIDRVYGEGVHVIPPWDRIEVYNTRVQETDNTVRALTSDGLDVMFTLSIRYKPDYTSLGLLHQKIGKDFLQMIVLPEVESVLRREVSRFSAEEIYTTKRAVIERVFLETMKQVEESYVIIDDVMIRSIELPDAIRVAVEAKMAQKHAAEAYRYELIHAQGEAKRMEIEAKGQSAYNDIIAKSITEQILRWKGIEATKEISKSENSKVIMIGNGEKNMPIIMGVPEK